jgi:CBS domain-containing protein
MESSIMYVKSIVEAKPDGVIAVSSTDTVRITASLFHHRKIGFALVKDHRGHIVGTISERDIVHALADRGDLRRTLVAQVLTRAIATCSIYDSLETARQIMTQKGTRHVVVMDGNAAIGIVSFGDLIKHSLDECRIDTSEMVSYINGQGYN